jgi:peptidyl-prolyl cis-trans isomerase SurA
LVLTDYQEQLEKDWVAALRKKYVVKVDEAVLKTVNKH